MPTQLADQPFSYFACMLISIIIANQLGSYVPNNSVPFGSWFISKIRYWYNRSNYQLFIYFKHSQYEGQWSSVNQAVNS